MIEATEVLDSYLRGIRRLSGARGVTLFVPVAFGGSEPLLLHSDDEPAAEEFADVDSALAFAARFEPKSGAGEGVEAPRMMSGSAPNTVLIPLPSLEPTWFWGIALERPDPPPATRRHADEEPLVELPPAAWLGLALGDPESARTEPPIPSHFPPEEEGYGGADWLWNWLFTLGGAIASHTSQVSTILRDPITGLADRVGLQAVLSEALERARLIGKPLSLLLVNPDDFTMVNERFGREAGDRVIREISDRLRGTLRKSDVVSRYGGVIFAILLLDTPAARARAVAEKILPILMGGAYLDGAVRLGFSIGTAAALPAADDPPSALELVRRADQALNSAKREGGGCIFDWELGTSSRQAGAFDRLSGIFTGDMAKDYRNMVLLSDTLAVIAEQQELDGLVGEVVDRLYTALRSERAGLLLRAEGDSADDRLELVAGLTRQTAKPGSQARLGTVELGARERELISVAMAAGEARGAELTREEESRRAYAVPLAVSGRHLGCLYIDGPSDSLLMDKGDLIFLEALASQVAVAIDRAKLSQRDQQRQEQEKKLLRAELNELRQALQQSKMVYRSKEMEAVVATARRVAPTDATVLITGESGTGKELLARTVHELSPRRDKRMVVVDCGAIATTLIESELFGHEKGAYTGAQQRRAGRLAEADGGTVLLDEIGELPLEVQSKLLRFVQEKQFVTLGGSRPRKVDVRILAATNRDLGAEVKAGRFREDLFHRLNVVRLEIPPLRVRPDDVLHLARHFLETYSIRYQKSPRRLTPEAEASLVRYDWPGNVRELQNRLMQAVILCETSELGLAELSLPEAKTATVAVPPGAETGAAAAAPPAADSTPEEAGSLDALLDRLRVALTRQVDQALAAGAPAAFPLGKWLGEDMVLEASHAAEGIARQGAALLGIPETTFRRRLQKATDQVQAGFSPRSGNWDEVRSAVADLIRSWPENDDDLVSLGERILLEEILERVPDDTGTGAKLLGVTPPTFRTRLSQLTPQE